MIGKRLSPKTSSTVLLASLAKSPALISSSSERISTRWCGTSDNSSRVGLAVPMSISLYICLASTEIISPSISLRKLDCRLCFTRACWSHDCDGQSFQPSLSCQPSLPMSGTNLKSALSTLRNRYCHPSWLQFSFVGNREFPTGTTSRPPTFNCSTRGIGISGAPAVTMIPSNGENSFQPIVPSLNFETYLIPSWSSVSRADFQ